MRRARNLISTAASAEHGRRVHVPGVIRRPVVRDVDAAGFAPHGVAPSMAALMRPQSAFLGPFRYPLR